MMISFVVVIFMLYTVTVSLTSQCNFVWDPSSDLAVYTPGVCSHKSFVDNTSSEYKCILHGPNQWHVEYNNYTGSANCDATQASVTSTIFNESTWGSLPSNTHNGTFQYECGGIDCPARIDLYMNELYGVNATNGSECEPGPLWSENIVVDDVCLCRTSNITACRWWGCTADGDYVMNAMGCNYNASNAIANETDMSTFTFTDGCTFVPYIYVDVNCTGTAPGNFNTTAPGNFNATAPGTYNTTESRNYNTTAPGNFNTTESGNYNTTESRNYNATESGTYNTTELGNYITSTTEWGNATESGNYNATAPGNFNTTELGTYNTTESRNYNATESGNYNTTAPGNFNTTELGNYISSTTESGTTTTESGGGDATESSDNTTTTALGNGTPQGNGAESNGFGYGIAILLLIINGLF